MECNTVTSEHTTYFATFSAAYRYAHKRGLKVIKTPDYIDGADNYPFMVVEYERLII